MAFARLRLRLPYFTTSIYTNSINLRLTRNYFLCFTPSNPMAHRAGPSVRRTDVRHGC